MHDVQTRLYHAYRSADQVILVRAFLTHDQDH